MHADSFKPPEQKEYQNPLILPWLIMLLIVHGWASMIHPLIRHKFGARYFGFREFFGFIVLWMFVGHNVHPNGYGIFVIYSAAVLGMMILHVGKANRSEHFFEEHHYYNGLPILMRMFPVKEVTAKAVVEPFFVGFAGLIAFYCIDQPLGVFLMIGAGMCMIDFARLHDRQMHRIRVMHKAEMEMRYTQQLYNDFKKGRR